MRTVQSNRNLGANDLHVLDSEKGDNDVAPRVLAWVARKCRVCRRKFEPKHEDQRCCQTACAVIHAGTYR